MSAVKVVRYLLAHNAPLLAVVPATEIMAGILPQDVALPALGVMHVSTTRQHLIAGSATELCTSRVQVTVQAADYPTQKAVLALVRAALKRQRGVIAGVDVKSVLSDVEGPDFSDAAAEICAGSIDWIVKFNE